MQELAPVDKKDGAKFEQIALNNFAIALNNVALAIMEAAKKS